MEGVRGGQAFKPDVMLQTLFFGSHLRNKAQCVESLKHGMFGTVPSQRHRCLEDRMLLKGGAVSKSLLYESQMTADLAYMLFGQRIFKQLSLDGVQHRRFFFLDSSPQARVDWIVCQYDEVRCDVLRECFKAAVWLFQSATRLQAVARETIDGSHCSTLGERDDILSVADCGQFDTTAQVHQVPA